MGLESKLQIACVNWFKCQYENPGRGMIVSFPNEGRRNAKTGGRLKSMGMKAGIPDLVVIAKGQTQVLFIEMKTEHKNSDLSPDQEKIHMKLKSFGQLVYVCRNLDEFMRVVNGWFARFS